MVVARLLVLAAVLQGALVVAESLHETLARLGLERRHQALVDEGACACVRVCVCVCVCVAVPVSVIVSSSLFLTHSRGQGGTRKG